MPRVKYCKVAHRPHDCSHFQLGIPSGNPSGILRESQAGILRENSQKRESFGNPSGISSGKIPKRESLGKYSGNNLGGTAQDSAGQRENSQAGIVQDSLGNPSGIPEGNPSGNYRESQEGAGVGNGLSTINSQISNFGKSAPSGLEQKTVLDSKTEIRSSITARKDLSFEERGYALDLLERSDSKITQQEFDSKLDRILEKAKEIRERKSVSPSQNGAENVSNMSASAPEESDCVECEHLETQISNLESKPHDFFDDDLGFDPKEKKIERAKQAYVSHVRKTVGSPLKPKEKPFFENLLTVD